jgi:cell division protein FtsQ
MPVHAPPDRRFRRARARPVRRRPFWKSVPVRMIRSALLVAFLVFVAYRAAALALAAPGFHVRQILVHGNQRLSKGEVLELVGPLRGENIVLTDLSEWRRQILLSSWVADAALRRILPSTVEIVISERMPIGLARFGKHLYLADARGTLIDEYGPQHADFDLPIIDGLGVNRQGETVEVDPARAWLAATLLEDLARGGGDLLQRVSQVDVRDSRDVVVILDGDSARVHLGEDRFVERLRSYDEMASALRQRVPEIDYVDLRFDERIYVRPARPARRIAPSRDPVSGQGTTRF